MPAKKTTTKKTTTKKTTAKSKASSKKASPKARTASTKSKSKASAKAKTQAGEQEVTLDRRTQAGRRDESAEQKPAIERREKVQRRRQIDPTTCERDYSVEEVAFMNAMDDYKRKSGRMFPTCSEVLEVIRNLGYVQLTPAELATVRPEPVEATVTDDLQVDSQDDFEEAELETADAAF